MSAIAIIPARGGSRRIPGKNKRLFHGKPIIAYSIETAKASGLFEDVIVSTDDDEIGIVAMQYGACAFPRSARTSADEIGTQEVTAEVLGSWAHSGKYDYACCIYPCAPMLSPATLQEAHAILEHDLTLDYVVPVATWLQDPGQFYFGKTSAFLHGHPLLSRFTAMLPIDPATECDVNFEADWIKCEQMYQELM